MSEAKPDELGVLWVKQGPKGEYMSGMLTIDGVAIPIVCFTNQFKKEAKHPDWRILRSQPRAEQPNRLPEREDMQKAVDDAYDGVDIPDNEIGPDDIPF